MAGHKKKAQKKGLAGPMAAEVQDPRRSPFEVREASLHREQLSVNPKTEPSAAEAILQLLREVAEDTKQLRAGQDSLLSDMAELRTSVSQMNQWFDLAESRFSSLEDRAFETHQNNSIASALPCNPGAAPAESSSSFSSRQTLLDPSGIALLPNSASGYASGTSTESAALSASSYNILLHVETEEKALRMLADAWSQERTSERKTAQTGAEESGHQEDMFSGASPEDYKPKSQPLTGILPESPEFITPVAMQKEAPVRAEQLSRRYPTNKISSSAASVSSTASAGHTEHPVSPTPTEFVSSSKRPRTSIAWHYFTKHPMSKFIATCNICGVDVKTGKVGGCGKVGTSALLKHLKCIHHLAREKAALSLLAVATSKTCNKGRTPTIEKPSRNELAASTGAATCVVTLHRLASSPTTEVKPSSKRPRVSIVWHYFTKHPTSKFVATCRLCGVDVKTGKIGGCGNVGTSALLSHLKCTHGIVRKK